MPKTDKKPLNDQELEQFFAAMQADARAPSDRLLSAIMDDAARLQPQPALLPVQPTGAPQRSFLHEVMATLGGWPAMAGMTTAAIAGVWLGVVAPAGLETLSGGLILSQNAGLVDDSFTLDDLVPDDLASSFLTEDDG